MRIQNRLKRLEHDRVERDYVSQSRTITFDDLRAQGTDGAFHGHRDAEQLSTAVTVRARALHFDALRAANQSR